MELKKSRGLFENSRRHAAFTLIELLVVVAIIGLLIGILVPSLHKAREQARAVTCQSNLHQIGTSIIAYASSDRGLIPYGPILGGLGPSLPGNDGTGATNQIWTGPQPVGVPPVTKPQYMALGLLMNRALAFPALLYCPADDSSDPREELEKIRKKAFAPGYCSYLYRQLDETDGRGRIENLGRNRRNTPKDPNTPKDQIARGDRAVALALDMNSVVTFDPAWYRTNHKAQRVNVLYPDGSVLNLRNDKQSFSLRDQDLADTASRLDEILQTADAAYYGKTP